MIFFFNDTATTEIYTLSLHDALPILTGNTLQLINVMAATLRASFHFGVRILIATFHATVAIMIHRTIAQVILIHHIDHAHDDLWIVRSVTVNLHIEDMTTQSQLMIRRFKIGRAHV